MINETELKEHLKAISARFGVKSYIFIYSEEDKFKIIGDVSASALAPIILKALTQKLTGQ